MGCVWLGWIGDATRQDACLIDRASGAVLVPRLEVTETAWESTRGLLGRGSLAADAGLLIPHCRSIHTCFMRFAIDAVFLEGGERVCKIVVERASEKEVLDLVRNDALEKSGVATKVLVALNGTDENAKLLAKEKRVLTLGLSRINMLMDIFGGSPIIHPKPDELRSHTHAPV